MPTLDRESTTTRSNRKCSEATIQIKFQPDSIGRYRPEQVSQAGNGEITLKAEQKNNWPNIVSGKMDTYGGRWSTAKDGHKNHGYLEVRANLPAKVNGGIFKGSWPAIWMLGNGNGHGWPGTGEIDIVEIVNGDPKVFMTTHSTGHNGGNGQHPSPHSNIQ
jgi:beta-glucanase (GH16 family)